jgi:hypothetical protein
MREESFGMYWNEHKESIQKTCRELSKDDEEFGKRLQYEYLKQRDLRGILTYSYEYDRKEKLDLLFESGYDLFIQLYQKQIPNRKSI